MTSQTQEQRLLPDVLAAGQGDVQAFSRLMQQSQRTVSSIALAIVKDLDASEDITQQVFIYAWKQLHSLNNPASFLPWLRQITRYRAFHYLRDNRVQSTERGEEAEALLESFCSGIEPEQDLAREQQNQLIGSLIEQLPDESREIVLLFYREEQNSQQVAQLLGLTEANVRKKLQRVRELLKAQWLRRGGELLCSTAPGLGLTTAVCAVLSSVAPPAAAATVSGLAASQSGWAKWLLLFSGAMLGAFVAVIGVIIGMQQPIKNADSPVLRQQLRKLRNQTVAWVLLSGLALTAAYELTSGAVAPLLCFTVFLAGLSRQQYRMWQLIAPGLEQKALFSAAGRRSVLWQKLGCLFGLVVGYGGGLFGMVYGLIQSGRL
ncbi:MULTISPECIES: RNA polymerase sigma factor [Rheinheimera]|uniref:RNA polymerase sigma factor n=1 Tax=Rheinheimera marina TaxID=1774958 RepID=A0ABV9JP60_9GAMM